MSAFISVSALSGCAPETHQPVEEGAFEIPERDVDERPEPEAIPEEQDAMPQFNEEADDGPEVEIMENDAANADKGEDADVDEPMELELPEQEMPEPEDIDIEDPEREPDTILAAVDGYDIALQDLYDEFSAIPAHFQPQMLYRQHELLHQMVQRHLLVQKAEELEIAETELFDNAMEQIKQSPMAGEFEEEELKESAMMEALIQQEVVDKVDISEEELKAIFEQYQQMMPEDADFEQMKPQLEQMMLQDHVQEYLTSLLEEADVELNEEWIEEKEEEAEAQTPAMPQQPQPVE